MIKKLQTDPCFKSVSRDLKDVDLLIKRRGNYLASLVEIQDYAVSKPKSDLEAVGYLFRELEAVFPIKITYCTSVNQIDQSKLSKQWVSLEDDIKRGFDTNGKCIGPILLYLNVSDKRVREILSVIDDYGERDYTATISRENEVEYQTLCLIQQG
ncbi:hypothetical protein [Vibrio agarivorans]|uniref:Uncharacterized protein n=1 Tax=Vibrio agarivorans TaxID=153622 RepID=A0ABT7Y7F2_9VIBR|nr:hypothetical protein [Vibrio agarivorans]MDN2483932.1 hypothetical protein [Vibrio agarivorans]